MKNGGGQPDGPVVPAVVACVEEEEPIAEKDEGGMVERLLVEAPPGPPIKQFLPRKEGPV